MCRTTKAATQQVPKEAAEKATASLWPVSPWVIFVLLPCMPTWCYVNRGYTQWFHWNSLFFALTQNRTHAAFLAMQGLTVTLGWYASLFYDWYFHHRFGHILYWNMPTAMTKYMMNGDSEVVYHNTAAVAIMLAAHALDILGHPLLAYYFWKQSSRNDNSCSHALSTVFDRFSWSVLISSYALSRFWSILHTWYNQGELALFYFGYDVYTIVDREASLMWFWLPAYIVEALVYIAFVVGKLYCSSSTPAMPTTTAPRPISFDRVPSALLLSNVSEAEG